MSNRNLFDEIMEGFDSLEKEREGKMTLRRHKIKEKPIKAVTSVELVQIRNRLNMSQGVFARHLHVDKRTLENWEQGRATPNKQASLLIRMTAKYPETIDRLEEASEPLES